MRTEAPARTSPSKITTATATRTPVIGPSPGLLPLLGPAHREREPAPPLHHHGIAPRELGRLICPAELCAPDRTVDEYLARTAGPTAHDPDSPAERFATRG